MSVKFESNFIIFIIEFASENVCKVSTSVHYTDYIHNRWGGHQPQYFICKWQVHPIITLTRHATKLSGSFPEAPLNNHPHITMSLPNCAMSITNWPEPTYLSSSSWKNYTLKWRRHSKELFFQTPFARGALMFQNTVKHNINSLSGVLCQKQVSRAGTCNYIPQ